MGRYACAGHPCGLNLSNYKLKDLFLKLFQHFHTNVKILLTVCSEMVFLNSSVQYLIYKAMGFLIVINKDKLSIVCEYCLAAREWIKIGEFS